jgi:hypothetical protein
MIINIIFYQTCLRNLLQLGIKEQHDLSCTFESLLQQNKLKSIVVTSNKIVVFDVIDGSIECFLLYRSMYSVVTFVKVLYFKLRSQNHVPNVLAGLKNYLPITLMNSTLHTTVNYM